jgi:hypothetical protein
MRRAGIVAGGLITAGIGKSLQEAGRFEYAEFQFKALMNSAEKAKDRMDEIRRLDLEVPFDITQLIDGSRALEVFTGGAEAGADALRMIADAAAVTPRPFKEVAYWYGRAFAAIKSNRPLGEANRRLLEMGIIGPEATQHLQALSKNYSPEAQALKMEIIKDEVKKFEGAAAELATTWPGLLSILSSGTKQTFEAVGDAILPLGKVWLQEILDKMYELRTNGTLTRWGENVAHWAERARKVVEEQLIPVFLELVRKVESYYNEMKSLFESEGLTTALGKAASDATEALVSALRKHMPTVVAVGAEIGGAIADGIIDGMQKALNDHPVGKRVAYYLGIATGSSIREVGRERAETRSSRQMALDTERYMRANRAAFGWRLHSAMGGDPNDLSTAAAVALAEKAFSDRAWAQRVLNVNIVHDQTKGEEIP